MVLAQLIYPLFLSISYEHLFPGGRTWFAGVQAAAPAQIAVHTRRIGLGRIGLVCFLGYVFQSSPGLNSLAKEMLKCLR